MRAHFRACDNGVTSLYGWRAWLHQPVVDGELLQLVANVVDLVVHATCPLAGDQANAPGLSHSLR